MPGKGPQLPIPVFRLPTNVKWIQVSSFLTFFTSSPRTAGPGGGGGTSTLSLLLDLIPVKKGDNIIYDPNGRVALSREFSSSSNSFTYKYPDETTNKFYAGVSSSGRLKPTDIGTIDKYSDGGINFFPNAQWLQNKKDGKVTLAEVGERFAQTGAAPVVAGADGSVSSILSQPVTRGANINLTLLGQYSTANLRVGVDTNG